MTGQYYQRELVKKYNVGIDSVRRIIHQELGRKKKLDRRSGGGAEY